MQPNQTQTKINALMAAKDHLERGTAILRIEGYNTSNQDYRAAVAAIKGIKSDIMGLQIGHLPFARLGHEET